MQDQLLTDFGIGGLIVEQLHHLEEGRLE